MLIDVLLLVLCAVLSSCASSCCLLLFCLASVVVVVPDQVFVLVNVRYWFVLWLSSAVVACFVVVAVFEVSPVSSVVFANRLYGPGVVIGRVRVTSLCVVVLVLVLTGRFVFAWLLLLVVRNCCCRQWRFGVFEVSLLLADVSLRPFYIDLVVVVGV